MLSSVLGNIAARASRLFARCAAPCPDSFPSSAQPSLTSSTLSDLSDLVSCTRSLVALTQSCGSGAVDAHLQRCVRECTDATLDALSSLPPRAHVPADVCVVLLVILRASVQFWQEDRCAALAQRLAEHVDAMALRTWRPRVLVATVHAFAKSCPSQAQLPLVTDCFVRLQHCEAQLTEYDVATVLWCLATLQVGESQLPLWSSLCKRAALLFSRMNRVNRLTVMQALLLQSSYLCESQAELLRVAHAANMESTELTSLDDYQRDGGWRCPARGPHRTKSHNSESSLTSSSKPGSMGSTSQLLQCTTHALSDESLVRLLITLFERSAEATEELRLVVAHLTLRSFLSDRLCLQLLRFTQSRSTAVSLHMAGQAEQRPRKHAFSTAQHSEMSVLLRKARRHAARQLIGVLRSGVARSPRDIIEVLCVEHCSLRAGGASEGQPRPGGAVDAESVESVESVWAAIVGLFCDTSADLARAFCFGSGEELWSWHCIAAYLRAVSPASGGLTSDVPASLGTTLSALEHQLSSATHPSRYWPNTRERKTRCAEVVIAATHCVGTQLLTYCAETTSPYDTALALLGECVRELATPPATLPAPTTLRLLSAVDEAPVVVAAPVQPLRKFLLAQLETHTARPSGMLPDLIQYLTSILAGPLAAWQAPSRVRVSDAVLDLYLRLLLQEQQQTLSAVHSELLVRCLQERRTIAAELENAFMMLLTRRLGQTASFLNTVRLPIAALSGLVELAGALPRSKAASTTATATMIISTLLDLLIQQAIPACTTAEELIAGAIALRDDAVADLQRTSAMAAAVQARGLSLLTSTEVTWTPVQKAYLIAALVCVNVDPTPELLQALRMDHHTQARGALKSTS
ncbi:conserved hypothetical protein [Leishmania major strain Friedlin]|uniref:Uncharacterized protein n=1 Tax=Leishmania major TaxID=5664 RepID=Q4QD24_LEIMA|nr:conserved hypothetical protein [Leishmania major strain Friedlin]CAG9573091.1 hypothetical_protein_-_conserved [Leishmania major strain Friedlin]CAJ03582.1 conserved hypothetical protein [Leishmania major strain Friedlin]|eukprot:XP_001682774.1 conserved hypothetical protein [Leishmania major strain Friedlin]